VREAARLTLRSKCVETARAKPIMKLVPAAPWRKRGACAAGLFSMRLRIAELFVTYSNHHACKSTASRVRRPGKNERLEKRQSPQKRHGGKITYGRSRPLDTALQVGGNNAEKIYVWKKEPRALCRKAKGFATRCNQPFQQEFKNLKKFIQIQYGNYQMY